MSTRTLATNVVDGYLKLLRRPADFAVGLLPGDRNGPGATATLLVDRVDASVRKVIGSVLGDVALKQDAQRRRTATFARERAVDLRREAQEKAERAEDRVQTRHQQADRQRQRATARANSRRAQANEEQQGRARRAEETERKRVQANREAEKRRNERIDAEAKEARLPAVAEQARALDERQAALDQTDEARRLGEAAARVKRERKETPERAA